MFVYSLEEVCFQRLPLFIQLLFQVYYVKTGVELVRTAVKISTQENKKETEQNQPSKPNQTIPVTGSCMLWLAEGDQLVSAVLLVRAGHLPVRFGIPPLAPRMTSARCIQAGPVCEQVGGGTQVQHVSCCHGTSSRGLCFVF